MIGSTRLARPTGNRTANSATADRSAGIATNTAGAHALTPWRKLAMKCDKPNVHATPITTRRASAASPGPSPSSCRPPGSDEAVTSIKTLGTANAFKRLWIQR